MRYIAAVVVAVLLPLSFAGSAEATRPIAGYPYKDQCKNIKGVQPIYMLIPPSKFVKTNKPGICRRVK